MCKNVSDFNTSPEYFHNFQGIDQYSNAQIRSSNWLQIFHDVSDDSLNTDTRIIDSLNNDGCRGSCGKY